MNNSSGELVKFSWPSESKALNGFTKLAVSEYGNQF